MAIKNFIAEIFVGVIVLAIVFIIALMSYGGIDEELKEMNFCKSKGFQGSSAKADIFGNADSFTCCSTIKTYNVDGSHQINEKCAHFDNHLVN